MNVLWPERLRLTRILKLSFLTFCILHKHLHLGEQDHGLLKLLFAGAVVFVGNQIPQVEQPRGRLKGFL